MSYDQIPHVPAPSNEPIRPYAPGDKERDSVQKALKKMASEKIEIPLVIGGKEVRTGNKRKIVMPHAHGHVLGEFHVAGKEELKLAAEAAMKAKGEWEAIGWKERAIIFLKAADLLATTHRDVINASTMLGQSKNIYQSEIDAVCELIDFFKFNAYFYQKILADQPLSVPGIFNQVDYRPLEGFVLAICPFNFTSIAANLAASPAMLGNTVLWKPSDTQVLSAHYTMKLFKEAGVPDGVINFVPADGPLTSEVLVGHSDLGGVHFTGSTKTFQAIYQTVSQNISKYRSYPRLVGETGGKDFVFAHSSSDVEALVTGLVRGAYEYQGQKCSAASRAYIPQSLWPKVKEQLLETIRTIKMGDVSDFGNFMNAVIDERSFQKIASYIDFVKQSSDGKVIAGGKADSSKGYFIEPTLVQTENPQFKTMVEEIFGPVLTVYVYPDNKFDETLEVCDRTSPYALTGAVFAQDRLVLEKMKLKLRNAAGNLYINDKPTGAVVGQQPFGGARASGTNDKAGSIMNLYRWLSARTIKEMLVPPKDYRYPFMGA